jgi:hypothetical protein
MTTAARAAGPRRMPRIPFVGIALFNVSLAVSYFLGLYLPFALFESANGTCHHTPCPAVHRSAWWSFYAEDTAFYEGWRSAVTTFVFFGPLLALFIWPLTVAVACFATLKATRTERWLSAVSAFAFVVLAILFLTPTGRRLYEVVLDEKARMSTSGVRHQMLT